MKTSKTIHIGIVGAKESLDRFEAAWEKAAQGKRVTPSGRTILGDAGAIVSMP